MTVTSRMTRFARLTAGAICVAIAGMLGGVAVADDGAWLSGPSTARLFEAVKFSGRNYVPNASVLVLVKNSAGGERVQAETVAGDGSLACEVTASVAGLYTLTVVDSEGRTLATANFLVGG